MEVSYKSKLDKFRNNCIAFISKRWFVINLLYIAAYLLYVIFKILHGRKSFFYSNADIGPTAPFSPLWFSLNIIGFLVLGFVLISNIKFKLWQYISIFLIGFVLTSYSFSKGSGGELSYEGSDVAMGNYIGGEEVVKYGVIDLIKTWNDRGNPYDERNSFELKDSVKKYIAENNLTGLEFDKWKERLDTSRYNLITNNRPFAHPPMTPIIIGLWLRIFPFGMWSVQFLMMFITFLTILMVIIYSYKKGIGNFSSIVILSIITAPVIYRFILPSVDQPAMLLFTIPLFLTLLFPTKKFWVALLYGVVYGLCFYVKFTIIYFVFFAVLSFLIYYKQLTFKYFLGFLTGLIIPFILFTSLGYYFWLTFITGHVWMKNVDATIDLNFFDMITKVYYFGPSFLLLFILMMLNQDKLQKNLYPFYIPLLISLIITMIVAYVVWNRYLIHFMPAFSLFLLSLGNVIELKKKDLLISLIANFVFLHLNNFF